MKTRILKRMLYYGKYLRKNANSKGKENQSMHNIGYDFLFFNKTYAKNILLQKVHQNINGGYV